MLLSRDKASKPRVSSSRMVGSLRPLLMFAFALISMTLNSHKADAQIVRIPIPNSNFPISQGVWVGKTYI